MFLTLITAGDAGEGAVTLEKGEDPRYYTLLPFGGAGGLAAALLAERLGMTRILFPPYQGVFSALGMLMADVKKEISRSVLKQFCSSVKDEINEMFSLMELEARQIMEEEGYDFPRITRMVDLRYKGQSFELTVPYTEDFLSLFHQKHQKFYSYMLNDSCCEIVNLRVLVTGETPKLEIEKKISVQGEANILYRKEIYFNGESRQFNIYQRSDLLPGCKIESPAIIVSHDATIVVPYNYDVSVDSFLNILLLKGKPSNL